jgi:hypothetical protein
MVAGLLIALLSYLPLFGEIDFGVRLAVTAFGSMAVWVPTMLLTRPESQVTLTEFYRRTRPGGPGWRRQQQITGLAPLQDLGADVRSGVLGIVLLFALLFGVGWLVLGSWGRGVAALALACVSFLLLAGRQKRSLAI